MSSGGKDCTLAFDRARRDELDVRWLASIYEGNTGRVRFHGLRQELLIAQADALALRPVLRHTHPEDFEPVFLRLLAELRDLGCTGCLFGNVHLADVRGWYEERVTAAGLAHREPLWGEPGMELVYEFVERGYRALVISVDPLRPAAPWLGRELDADLLTEIGITEDLDPSGERGEYHTFAWDGPLFRRPVTFEHGATLERDGHQFIDLAP
jgi:uncharacterized protein (TIGR00290 family)